MNRIFTVFAGNVVLIHDDCSIIRGWKTDFTLFLDPPQTIRSVEEAEHLQHTLGHTGLMLCITNPVPGYILNGVFFDYPHIKTEGGIQRPLLPTIELFSKTTGLIVDPYAGTGTTLVAAMLMGRPAVGIEKSATQYHATAERLRQAETQTQPQV